MTIFRLVRASEIGLVPTVGQAGEIVLGRDRLELSAGADGWNLAATIIDRPWKKATAEELAAALEECASLLRTQKARL